MLSISFYFVYVPNFHPAFSAKQLTIHNVFQAESFNFIEGGAGNSSELIHSYVNPFTRSSVTSRSEYKLYNRISVIVVSRMMLNLMEAVDPLGGDFSEDSNYHPEGRPQPLHFSNRHSEFCTLNRSARSFDAAAFRFRGRKRELGSLVADGKGKGDLGDADPRVTPPIFECYLCEMAKSLNSNHQ